ncbi:hypothetical protein [Escherichia coli]|uniref:hypothetical protein n=1 Tax=Escherichia coli TaxID=562 RepID=UPI00204065BD|nr:hypothetical protein [Escherichia coli]
MRIADRTSMPIRDRIERNTQFGAYQVLDAWIARVSREEREALEARQQAMMEGQQEGGHVSH